MRHRSSGAVCAPRSWRKAEGCKAAAISCKNFAMDSGVVKTRTIRVEEMVRIKTADWVVDDDGYI
jgi:hypothetical protein